MHSEPEPHAEGLCDVDLSGVAGQDYCKRPKGGKAKAAERAPESRDRRMGSGPGSYLNRAKIRQLRSYKKKSDAKVDGNHKTSCYEEAQ